MRRTIFRDIFMSNMVTVLLSIIVTAALLYTQLGSYFKNSVYESLTSSALKASDAASFVLSSFTEPIADQILSNSISVFGEGNRVIIANTDGKVIASEGFEDGDNLTEVSRDVIMRSLFGETVAAQGYLGGILSENSLYVMVPVNVSGKIWGVMIVCSTEPYIKNMQFDVMGLFLSAVMIAAILSFVISALFSQKLVRPIREMTQVARKIASGDFSQRVKEDTGGEISILAASFNNMSQSIKEMDEMQSSFISDVSHELRTPMTIISGFVEGILDGTIPESEQKKYLGVVLSEIKRLNRLVNDLLEMSRLKSGKIEYKMLPFDINENIRQAIISFDQKLSEKNIELKVEFEKDSSYVMGSRDSIYRVITNLMDNAIKFAPENGEIIIKSYIESGKGVVSIQNSGSGLSEKELSHIWDRFYQTDKSRTSTSNRGVGLGLYIVRNVMAAHGGDIHAESEEGKWTRFVFKLDSVKKQFDKE